MPPHNNKKASAKKPAKASQKPSEAAQSAPKPQRAPRKQDRHVRNLRGSLVHVKLEDPERDKEFRLHLKARGNPGDIVTVPARFVGDPQFSDQVGRLYEIITRSEMDAIKDAYGPVGYLGRGAVVVERVQDNTRTVATIDNTGARGQQQQNFVHTRVNPHVVVPPGGDANLANLANNPGRASQGLDGQPLDASTDALVRKGVMAPLPRVVRQPLPGERT